MSTNALVKLNTFSKKYISNTGNTLEHEFLLAQECSKLYENRIKNIWPDFKLIYKKNLTSFSDESTTVTSLYVSLNDIYKAFSPIQNSVFEGNVRYLNNNSRINDGIKDTILNDYQNFHLLNNGITIVCKSCNDNTPKSMFDIRCGTIINGAQTVGTIINTLDGINEEKRKEYEKSFVFVRIVSFEKNDKLINNMVYTLNTQNQMKSSYTIANDAIVKRLQNEINKETDFFLEIKNNEYNYNKNNDNINKIINELDYKKSMLSYTVYLDLMDIIKDYRAYRKNHEKIEILNILSIDEKQIDEYKFLNTGNILILFAIGQCYAVKNIDPCINIVPIIKALKIVFKKETNIANTTKIKDTFDKVENLVKKFKVDNGIITVSKNINISKL